MWSAMIDLHKCSVLGTIGLDELQLGAANPWEVAVTADGSQICVAASGTHELCVISTQQLNNSRARRTMSPLPGAWPIYPSLGESLWRRVALPGKGPRGVVVVGSTAYVSQYYSDSLAVVDLTNTTAMPPRTIALGPPPVLTQQRRGQMLFDDATICYQSWQSCASCHPDGACGRVELGSDERWDRQSQEFQEYVAGTCHATGHVQGCAGDGGIRGAIGHHAHLVFPSTRRGSPGHRCVLESRSNRCPVLTWSTDN